MLTCSYLEAMLAFHGKIWFPVLDTAICTLSFILIYSLLTHVQRFSRPILHGLCTLGFAVRAIIKCICKGDPDMIKNISGRFLLHVYPGETLVTEMWLKGLRYNFVCYTASFFCATLEVNAKTRVSHLKRVEI